MITRLQKRYRQTVVPALQAEFKLDNVLAVPTVKCIILNASFGKFLKDNKLQDAVVSTLTRVSGQRPVLTKAKKSISAFKLRQGTVIGAMVTLRGSRMWEFLDKFINVSLARVRDFHGLDPQSLGQGGSLTVGLKEHIVFPEIRSDEVEHLHGLEVTIVTTADNRRLAQALLTKLGFPFSSPK